jgi:hypothetical protein
MPILQRSCETRRISMAGTWRNYPGPGRCFWYFFATLVDCSAVKLWLMCLRSEEPLKRPERSWRLFIREVRIGPRSCSSNMD